MSAEIDETIISQLGDFERDIDSDDVDRDNATPRVPYIQQILQQSSLKLLQEPRTRKAYKDNGYLGLFRLFINGSWFQAMRTWLNMKREEKGLDAVNENMFYAYVGLEMAMSLVNMNTIDSYWRDDMFMGQKDFKETMSRPKFTAIRSNLTLCNPTLYDHEEASKDPLWHSRKLLEHFQRNISKIAVPLCASALDEAGFGSKARTKALSYCPLKPDKYAIRFYAVVGHANSYLSSLFDNRSGNTTSLSPPEAYCRLHRDLRTPFNKIFDNQDDVSKDSPSALWVLMCAHQTKLAPDPSGKRLFFCDNFYTRHVLAKCLKRMTDGEARVIGTVKFTNVDATNRFFLTQAIQQLKDADRGSWKLVCAYDKADNLDELRRKHTNVMRKKPAKQRTPFVPPRNKVADKAAYIVWKDKKIVIFYTNYLTFTLAEPILDGGSEGAIKIVHGLAQLGRWTGGEVFHRTTFLVPAPIVAYNLFMNSVDRMDQKRSALPCKRKEMRLHMSCFTYILDLACLQAFAIHQVIKSETESVTLLEFKRQLCVSLVAPYRAEKKRKQNLHVACDANFVLGNSDEQHMLLENLNKKDIDCYLCRLRGIAKRTIYGCCACGKGYCVNCFTAYHCKNVLSGHAQALVDTIVGTNDERKEKRSKYVQNAKDLQLIEKK